jgi:DNA-binding transcriptional LysR family regulator
LIQVTRPRNPPPQEPVETAELLAFSKTVEARSLSRAARELGVPRATISRRLARLEERLGTRLLRRSTRSLTLTDSGEAFYRHARIVLEAVGDAEASVRRDGEHFRGTLRVSAPPLNSSSFQALMCEFAARHPDVRLQLHFTSQVVDLVKSGYDVALRAGTGIGPGLVARTLMKSVVVVVASPEYLARHGSPRGRRDLRDHRCLTGFARGEVPQTHWPLVGGGEVHVEGTFSSNDLVLLCEAALAGLGMALLPVNLVRPHLRSGALVQVLAGVVGAESRFAIVYPERELQPAYVRAFIDTVVAWAPGELERIALARPARRSRRERP